MREILEPLPRGVRQQLGGAEAVQVVEHRASRRRHAADDLVAAQPGTVPRDGRLRKRRIEDQERQHAGDSTAQSSAAREDERDTDDADHQEHAARQREEAIGDWRGGGEHGRRLRHVVGGDEELAEAEIPVDASAVDVEAAEEVGDAVALRPRRDARPGRIIGVARDLRGCLLHADQPAEGVVLGAAAVRQLRHAAVAVVADVVADAGVRVAHPGQLVRLRGIVVEVLQAILVLDAPLRVGVVRARVAAGGALLSARHAIAVVVGGHRVVIPRRRDDRVRDVRRQVLHRLHVAGDVVELVPDVAQDGIAGLPGDRLLDRPARSELPLRVERAEPGRVAVRGRVFHAVPVDHLHDAAELVTLHVVPTSDAMPASTPARV